jgi:predicted PurR-regulated permease PerM
MPAIHFSARVKTLLVWGVILLTLGFLVLVRQIVTPFLWALVTAFILNAMVAFLTRRVGGPRTLWVILVYFGLVAGLVWLITAVVPALFAQARQLMAETPVYAQQIESFLQANHLQLGSRTISAREITTAVNSGLNDFLGGLSARAPELVRDLLDSLLKLLIYLIATFFTLLQAEKIVANIRSLFPSDVLQELDPWFRRITTTLGAYLRGQVLLIAIVSTATFIGLTILGVRFPLALAIMSGIVETIPYLGPYAAGAVATLVALTQIEPNNFGWAPLMLGVAVAIMYTVIRQIEDNLIMPLVIGRTVELHPLTVIFVVLAGATLGGILGLLLAVPTAATVKIIAEFLWRKINEPDPRETLAVGPRTTWDRIARRMRGAPGGRLLLVMPAGQPTPVLAEPADFHRLLLLAGEQGVEARIITDDPEIAAQARAAGLLVDEQAPAEFARTATSVGAEPITGAIDVPVEDRARPAGPPAPLVERR